MSCRSCSARRRVAKGLEEVNAWSAATWRWRTFKRSVEHEAANADEEIAKVSDGEDVVMAMLPAAFDAFPGEIEEQKIGQGIDNLG